ncbi:hypothetical protein [Stakelama tenebrarum]|uniref:Lipoprotein n=1 Tax=Stakelama tenebrarum TaxID=2711215 RepID=A0A6G6Y3Z7_9SPHN|nr:hypothetical protein [Sphingosinithalassobacter tenebrarum]QIG79571.1 hypothetical protein G5C33_07045 [Sphingosinithalassobacter tenebrarum]
MFRFFIAAALAATLGACSNSYVATPYTGSAQPITKVAISDHSTPEEIAAFESASVGSNFGLIGALIDAGVQDSREDALDAALATVDFDAEADMETALVSAFAEKGVSAAVVENGNREKGKFLVRVPDQTGEAQVFLDIVVTHWGYAASGSGKKWRPSVYASVRLLSLPDHKTLMENRIAYNVLGAPRGVVTLAPNPEYAFENRDEMKSDPERLAEGLRDAMHRVAETAVGLLQ